MAEAFFVVPSDHPSLAGHFPGRPVVPGVVILDEVVAAIRGLVPGAALAGFANVKFHTPLDPGRRVEVSWNRQGPRAVAFSCRSGSVVFAAGIAEFEGALP
jgi:3-hydroxyacyl-[acyl-carrier-protein] dehydratase